MDADTVKKFLELLERLVVAIEIISLEGNRR
jgi:hypothetical protein